MLKPDYLDELADEIAVLYDRFQTNIINDIAKRIARIGMSQTSVHQLQLLEESGAVFDNVISEIGQITRISDERLKKAFFDAGGKSMTYDQKIYRAAGLQAQGIRQSYALSQVLYAGLAKTNGLIHNLTMTTAHNVEQSFIDALDTAYTEAVTGTNTQERAVRRAIDSIADKGMRVTYPSGHSDKVDVAIARAVRTGINQTCAAMRLALADEMNCHLVETTAHAGARPAHTTWQGRVFDRNYPPKDGYENFEDATGFGTVTGLCGANCRHNFFPFIEGVSKPRYSGGQLEDYEAATVVYNGKEIPMYEATQKQRAMERRIRETKRKLTAYETAGVDKFSQASVKLKQQEARLRDFIKQTGLPKRNEGTQVAGFGRSTAQKAVWANKKAQE